MFSLGCIFRTFKSGRIQICNKSARKTFCAFWQLWICSFSFGWGWLCRFPSSSWVALSFSCPFGWWCSFPEKKAAPDQKGWGGKRSTTQEAGQKHHPEKWEKATPRPKQRWNGEGNHRHPQEGPPKERPPLYFTSPLLFTLNELALHYYFLLFTFDFFFFLQIFSIFFTFLIFFSHSSTFWLFFIFDCFLNNF